MTAKKSDELKPKNAPKKSAKKTDRKKAAQAHTPKEEPKETALEQRIADLEKALQQEKDQVLRAKAAIANTERLAKMETQKARQFALESFAKELLPVIDSLELALSNGGAPESDHAPTQKVHEGVELTLKMLLKVIGKFHLKAINPIGAPFDPQLHQAVSTQPSDEVPSNSILQVLQKGYTLHDRLIRPAMVIVAA